MYGMANPRSWQFDKDFVVAFLFVTCIKFLFMPMYHSTDMEVHRNWMAITHSKNISEWYFEDTSQWTLDYPPLFAWFEYALSFGAKYFDASMLNVKNLNYDNLKTLFFLRTSVVISDILYILAVMKIHNLLKKMQYRVIDDPWVKPEVIFAMLMLWNPGLLLVDNIHFQYNGFLNGFLFFSIAAIMQENYLQAAFWYAVLLNFKHIYLYLAPVYFVFLLKVYCFKRYHMDGRIGWKNFSFINFFKLSSVVLAVFLVSFGPFLSTHQLRQVLRRMFPVQRGLTHAYWAPNVWALYNTFDRILVVMSRYWNGSKGIYFTSVTKGLVEDYEHAILPSIKVEMTFFLTVLSLIPFMWHIWKTPRNDYISFLRGLVGCAFGSFIFGFHVHEKAIMMITLPLTILAISDPVIVKPFILLSSIGNFSLFPLLHQTAETPIKVIVLLLHSVYMYTSLKHLHKHRLQRNVFSVIEQLLLAGVPIVQLFYSFGLRILSLEDKLPFLPLMLFSAYCTVCVLYCFWYFCAISFQIRNWPWQTKQKI